MIMDSAVPTVCLRNLLGCPRAGRSARWMYAWCAGSVLCQPVLRLFFSRRPAVCRISSCVPSPWVRMNAR